MHARALLLFFLKLGYFVLAAAFMGFSRLNLEWRVTFAAAAAAGSGRSRSAVTVSSLETCRFGYFIPPICFWKREAPLFGRN